MKRELQILLWLLFFNCGANAQKSALLFYNKTFQLTIAPGLSTNGIDPDNYYNNFSFNLISGYSAGNRILEVGGVSNFNKYSSTGLQIAGLSNVIGGDRKVPKAYKPKELVDIMAHFHGIQLSGLQNIVTGDVTGIQISGAINNDGGIFYGMQAAGLVNKIGGYFYGFQVAGLANIVPKYSSGVQLAGLANITHGSIHGVQIALINMSKRMYGPKSLSDFGHGMQIGLYNKSGNMDGYQIGLVNKSDDSKGWQIGLVNIMQRSGGYPIALLNYGRGVQAGMRAWINDYLTSNVGFSTGNDKLQNILYYGKNFLNNNEINWVIGYGLERNVFINNGDAIISYQLYNTWVNPTKKLNKSLNLILTPMVAVGKHIGHNIYLYAGVGLNAWIKKNNIEESANNYNPWWVIHDSRSSSNNFLLWPALSIGIRTN